MTTLEKVLETAKSLTPEEKDKVRKALDDVMATGTGKTIVMPMLIAWQSLNKINTVNRKGFAKDFLIIAPNLTVRSRLSVLIPAGEGKLLRRITVKHDNPTNRVVRHFRGCDSFAACH